MTKLQKRAIRSIGGKDTKTHTDPLFKKYKLLKFEDIIEYNKLSIAHTIFYNYAPTALKEHIKREIPHPRLRRNTDNLQIDGSNIKSISRYQIPFSWNKLDSETKDITSKSKFKSAIKKSFFQKYSNLDICNVINCRTCNNS